MGRRYLIVEKKTKGKTFTLTLMGTGGDLLKRIGDKVNELEKDVRGVRIVNAQSPFVSRVSRAKKQEQEPEVVEDDNNKPLFLGLTDRRAQNAGS